MKRFAWLFGLIPLIMTLIWLQFLPERVPVHYSLSGAVDSWGSKWFYLLLPAVVLATVLAYPLIARSLTRKTDADEKSQAHGAANVKVVQYVMLATILLFTVLQAVLLCSAGRAASGEARSALPLTRIVVICLGVMLIVLGNVMPKAKRNSAVGFRCGWTMFNDVTWQKSNRFSGAAMILAGLGCAVAAALAPEAWAIPILFIALTAAVAASLVYARRVYREETGKE